MASEQQGGLKHFGECLSRHHGGTYYAPVKVTGKQIKRCEDRRSFASCTFRRDGAENVTFDAP